MTRHKDKPGAFAQRMKALRLSLDPGTRPEVSAAAMNRLFGSKPTHRHQWLKLEAERDTPDANMIALADWAMTKLVEALDLKDPEKALGHLTRYVRGELSTLPWSSPPSWKDGQSPIRQPGRPTGSRVIGPTAYVPPGALTHATLEAASPFVTSSVDPALVILEQVRDGVLDPNAALAVLRALLPHQQLTGAASGMRGAKAQFIAAEDLAESDLSFSPPPCASFPSNGGVSRPLTRKALSEALLNALPRLSPEALEAVKQGLRRERFGVRQLINPDDMNASAVPAS